MIRQTFVLMLAAALSFSWAAPLCAEAAAPSHACCPGGKAPASEPASSDGGAAACCRPADLPPLPDAVALAAPAPALAPSSVAVREPRPAVSWVPERFIPAAPQSPPGTHSGLSPPACGL